MDISDQVIRRRTKGPQLVAGVGIIALVVWLVLAPESFRATVDRSFEWAVAMFGGLWQVTVFVLFIATVVSALSPVGRLKLGSGAPELSYGAWLAIIMSTLLAGGGIFWSAAEPLFHFQERPLPFSRTDVSGQAAAMAQSYLHWGFLAWTALGTLAIIPLQFRANDTSLRNRPAALLYPIVPARLLRGILGQIVDLFAVIAVLVGTIGPIGFLGLQLSYILSESTSLPNALITQLLVIALLAIVYTFSAILGVRRGIRVLSLVNMGLCIAFGALVLISVSLADLGGLVAEAGGAYAGNFLSLAFADANAMWTHNWTHFFWGWFLGYGPIMAIFMHRISRGRTIREVFLTICIVAPLITNFWFSVVGGSGILLEQASDGAISSALASNGMPAALLQIIELGDATVLLTVLVIPLIFLFMATTGDSIALSVATIFSKENEPDKRSRAFWALSMAAVAAAMLAVGGVQAISLFQQTIVIAAVPVSVLMIVASAAGCLLLWKYRGSDALDED